MNLEQLKVEWEHRKNRRVETVNKPPAMDANVEDDDDDDTEDDDDDDDDEDDDNTII
jgi:hypothetical protein